MFDISSVDSTPANYHLYEVTMQGASPVSLADMKTYLGGPNAANDDLIQSLIDACTDWGEKWTGREFRANLYTLLIDCFEERIELRRNPIDTIDSVEHSVTVQFDTTVASTVYYKKDGVQRSEILLLPDQSWPTVNLDIEQGIKITFTTKAVGPDKLDIAITAIKRHVAYMFENRGDCADCGGCSDAANVLGLYAMIRIPRI